MKRFLSYLWPITKKVRSNINGILELTWIDGKKMLNTQNANYSYGSLQRLLSFGLSQININATSEILLLGLGGGSVIQTLREEFNYNGNITAVEIDEIVIKIAKEEFQISEQENLKIICDDAFLHVEHSKDIYELIIVDIFIDNKVPEQFYTPLFWEKVISISKSKGHIIFNAGINLENNSDLEQLKSAFINDIKFEQYNHVEGANTLLIGKKL